MGTESENPGVSAGGFQSIDGLVVSEAVADGLETEGIGEPSEVQREAIPAILAGRSLIVESATGTGKTLAYLLPVLQRLGAEQGLRAVVFTPATELAIQVLRVAEQYKASELNCGALVATGSLKYQKSRVTKSTRLMVGTPGRILEQYAARKMKRVGIVVLDEPDAILRGKDGEYLREILSRPEPKVQLVVVGATLGAAAEDLCREFMGPDALRTRTTDAPLLTHIAHSLEVVDSKADAFLARYLKSHRCKRALVFVNQPRLIGHLYRVLSRFGLSPLSLSPGATKQQRRQAIEIFRKEPKRVMLATDASALGLDIPDLEWVLHYELAPSVEAYVHRAGRTGRAGKRGHSVVLVSSARRYIALRHAESLGFEFEENSSKG